KTEFWLQARSEHMAPVQHGLRQEFIPACYAAVYNCPVCQEFFWEVAEEPEQEVSCTQVFLF
ncbi:hypothetical protein ATR1_272c0001, partial [Acetobacter tropicalis]